MRRPTTPAVAAAALVAAAVVGAAALVFGVRPFDSDSVSTRASQPAPTVTVSQPPSTALDALRSLRTVVGTTTGYSRAQFGAGWGDPDGNGCDTRDDTLARDLTATTVVGRCDVTAGTLTDSYTGLRFTGFTRGLDIDHTVALADAWRTGAQGWDRPTRVAFANDPANLVATLARVNRSKGDKGPDQWSPVTQAAACVYAARYVGVKAAHDLGVTPPQRAALEVTLTGCQHDGVRVTP